jgi:hypothetical protein
LGVTSISLAEIQGAFERAIGYAPIDQATVLLQRLPGLGRSSADTNDRRFIDTYLLEGLRATHVFSILNGESKNSLNERWINPLGENGALICGRQIDAFGFTDRAIDFCLKNKNSRNQTFLLDVLCSVFCGDENDLDFRGLQISQAYAATMNVSEKRFSNLHLEQCGIEKLVVSGSDAHGVRFEECLIQLLEGVSSESGVPKWIENASIDHYSSVATTSRIKLAKLSPTQKVLVTILRKTFFQKGAGRKEEALTRGLGRLVKPGTVSRVLGKLKSEGLLSEEKGSEGSLFIPNRGETHRAGKMIGELSLSKDSIWQFVSQLTD